MNCLLMWTEEDEAAEDDEAAAEEDEEDEEDDPKLPDVLVQTVSDVVRKTRAGRAVRAPVRMDL